MSTWNRSYLEAIGLPVWVSRQAAVADHDTAAEDLSVSSQEEVKSSATLWFAPIAGSQHAKVCILVTAEQDIKQVQANFQSLAAAWAQWIGTEFPLMLVQLSEQAGSENTGSEHSDSEKKLQPLDKLTGKKFFLASNESVLLAEVSAEKVASLNWQSASDKKAWWHLLQTFA